MKRDDYGKNWSTPVLILNCKIGGLAIMRTLGALGTPIYGVESNPHSPELRSKYLKKYFIKQMIPENPKIYLDYILALFNTIGEKAVLIPTSDELSLFVAEHRDALKPYYFFPENTAELLDQLSDKQKMFSLAIKQSIPTPNIISPKNIDDVKDAIPQLSFPLMLKAIDGNRLLARTGKKMVIVNDENELLTAYKELEDFSNPNLMLQEMIPGDDDQVYIFNGYFNENSDCLAAFTGHKVRQYPIHVGCASLGECRWHERVAIKTISLMKAVGYKGILDIGYRLDPRDNRYKVLDINPRVGQAFRIFVAENDMDVIRSLYLDLTGQEQPAIVPIDGRRWLIEDYDIISSLDYSREHSLSLLDWIRSLKHVRESAWFSWKDPLPFLIKFFIFIRRGLGTLTKKAKKRFSPKPKRPKRV